MKTKKFGESIESPPSEQWYEDEQGVKVSCGEDTIDVLWNIWVVTEGVIRESEDNCTVFIFPNYIEI